MKAILLLAAAAAHFLCARTAFAADAAPHDDLPSPLWTGFYAGFNAGYSWDASPKIFVAGFPLRTGFDDFSTGTYAFASALGATGISDAKADGPIGGAQIGYDHRLGDFVVGVEADIQGFGARGRRGFLGAAGATISGFDTDVVFTAVDNEKAVDWLGSLRGRVGYLLAPTLLGYATGGLAYGGADAHAQIFQTWNGAIAPFLQSTGAADGRSTTLVGWTVGGGAEWALAPYLSIKAEYLYYGLGAARFASTPLTTSLFDGLSNTIVAASRARFDGHVARLGLNYHFDRFRAEPSAAPVPSAPAWSGLYAGLSGGYVLGGGKGVSTTEIPVRGDVDGLLTGGYVGLPHSAASAVAATGVAAATAHGFAAGGQIGFNYRFDDFVAGVETDIQGSGAHGHGRFSGVGSARAFDSRDVVRTIVEGEKSVDWFGTLRGRIGRLVTPALLGYATGGLAYGKVTARTTTFSDWGGNILGPILQSSNSAGNFSGKLAGWSVGGGVEWAFAPHLSLEAQYLYYDLGDAKFASSPSATTLLAFFSNTALPVSKTRFDGHVARAGLNYHFNLFDNSISSAAAH